MLLLLNLNRLHRHEPSPWIRHDSCRVPYEQLHPLPAHCLLLWVPSGQLPSWSRVLTCIMLPHGTSSAWQAIRLQRWQVRLWLRSLSIYSFEQVVTFVKYVQLETLEINMMWGLVYFQLSIIIFTVYETYSYY